MMFIFINICFHTILFVKLHFYECFVYKIIPRYALEEPPPYFFLNKEGSLFFLYACLFQVMLRGGGIGAPRENKGLHHILYTFYC